MMWLRGWRLPLRLARRGVSRRPGRTVLVALLMAIPVAALSLLAIAYRTTLRDDDTWVIREFGAADAVTHLGADCECDRRTPFESQLPSGTQVVWGVEGFIHVRAAAQDKSYFAFVTSVDMGHPLTTGVRQLAQGRWPAGTDEAAIDGDLADLFGVAIGAQLQLAHQDSGFEVVGLVEAANEYGPMIAAPGFNFEVIRPQFRSDVGFIGLQDSFDESLPGEINFNPLSPAGAAAYGMPDDDRLKTTLGWLGGVLAMSVFGVVIAAAFAVSGRRQLANLGQLSASGVDRRTIVRALTMEGTVTGVIGAGLGFAIAAVVHSQAPNPFDLQSPAVVSVTDMVVLFATAVLIATIAALFPARSLGRVSVLTAMAGRRPVHPVSSRRVWLGTVLVVAGLTVTPLAMRSENQMTSVVLAALGIMAVLLGVCALSGLLVEKLTGLAAHSGGALRLSARSIARSGPRAAAVFAALLLVGMTVTGLGARAEQGATGDYWADRSDRGDLFWVTASTTTLDSTFGITVTPSTLSSRAATRSQARDIVGDVVWTSVAAAHRPNPVDPNLDSERWLVATDDLLDLLNISDERRITLKNSPGGVEFVRLPGRSPRSPDVPIVVEPYLSFGFSWVLITASAADKLGLVVTPGATEFGIADHDLDSEEVEALSALTRDDSEGLYYSDSEPVGHVETWQFSRMNPESMLLANRVRVGTIIGALLLVGLLVLIGMSLMSVEGRGERDLLIAVGVGPGTIARMAGWRTSGLTFAAMAIAVPSGLAISWLIYSSAHVRIATPWLLAGLLMFALPIAAGLVAWVSSALDQRLRPLQSNSLAAD